VFAGRPVMIVVEYMENGSLDSFLRVSVGTDNVCFQPQVEFSVGKTHMTTTTKSFKKKTKP